MRNHLKTIFAVTITSLMLFGCKADKIETSIGSEDLRKAIAGNTVSIEFKAEFSMMGDTEDEETKSQIKLIKNVVEKYISVEEFDITKGDFGFNITVEGDIPLVYSTGSKIVTSSESPWIMKVSDNIEGGILSNFSHKLTFSTGPQFSAFSAELEGINFMLSPDQRQPMKFKIKNTGNSILHIFTGGVEVGGESQAVYESRVEKRVSLTMKGGVYDSIEQVIYFSFE